MKKQSRSDLDAASRLLGLTQDKETTLSELANAIEKVITVVHLSYRSRPKHLPIDAATQDYAKRNLNDLLFIYLRLGGKDFEQTDDPAVNLIRLQRACYEEMLRMEPLQERDLRILKHLAKAKTSKLQADLSMELDINEKMISQHLKYLRNLGLTYLPRGPRMGEMITERGRNFLKHSS